MKKILVCANPDLNLIDGSSVWSQTITLVLAETGMAWIDFLAKSRPQRMLLFEPLRRHGSINIIDGIDKCLLSDQSGISLQDNQLVEAALKLHCKNDYDIILVRGLNIVRWLTDYPGVLNRCWIYLTDIPQKKELVDDSLRQELAVIAHGAKRILYQAPGFLELWNEIVPDAEEDKFSLYSPVIPDIPYETTKIANRPLKAVYAGKFKRTWKTLEMAKTWPNIKQEVPEAELIMIGDKIHAEQTPADYQQQMRKALENTVGLRWLGALPRDLVQKELETARVGLSWRDECMDDTLEYSTKILEYGAAGCAAILNRNALHENLLGRDYPLFANTEQDYVDTLKLALTNSQVAQLAADRLMSLARRHTFSERVKQVRKWLGNSPIKKKKTILVAGHDLKFFSPLQKKLEETGKYAFLVDKWSGHCSHDEKKSKKLLEHADIIFCEWCLGNISWYAANKKPGQKLIARFHQQERKLSYLKEADHFQIDHIVYVSDFIKREGQSVFSFPERKTSVIPNLINQDKFWNAKKVGDARFTLGMVGIVPKMKRMDLAIEALDILLEKDPRYQLRIKGKHPLDHAWIVNNKEEFEYYQKIMQRINENDHLRYKVVFDPPGDDVNKWFTMVGFILSPSDFESFHLAVGEGMLTGCVPIVWKRDGAKEIWPKEAVVENHKEAAKKISDLSIDQWMEMGRKSREIVLHHYGSVTVVSWWDQILSNV